MPSPRQFGSMPPPSRPATSARAREGLDVDLVAPGLVRRVRDVAPSGENTGRGSMNGVCRNGIGFRPRTAAAPRCPSPSPCPASRRRSGSPVRVQSARPWIVGFEQSVFSAPCPLAAFSKRCRRPARVDDPPAVGRPDGQHVVAGSNVKRELTPRARSRIQMSPLPFARIRRGRRRAARRPGDSAGRGSRPGRRRVSRAPAGAVHPDAGGPPSPRSGRRACRRARPRSAPSPTLSVPTARRAGPARRWSSAPSASKGCATSVPSRTKSR